MNIRLTGKTEILETDIKVFIVRGGTLRLGGVSVELILSFF